MPTEKKDFVKLSLQDVQLLKNNPSIDVRTKTICKLAGQYKTQNLSSTEQQITEDIFRLILSDPHTIMRSTLATSLKNCNFLPPDIIHKITSDIPAVACPFIQESPLLYEKDLTTLIREKNDQKQSAIAKREELSFRVCETLIEEGSLSSTLLLIQNEKADISDYAFQRLLERLGDDTNIQKALLVRKRIPTHILEKLIGIVSDELKKQLLMRRDLSAPLVTAIVSQLREKAILSLAQSSTEEEVRTLVIHLNGINRLTSNLILRAACVGDMKFFEYAVAMRAGIPIRNTRILIYDSGIMGLERIYEEADLPQKMFPAIRLAIKTYKEMMDETEDGYRDHFCRRLVERLLILFDEEQIKLDSADMDYFLRKIGKKQEDDFDIAV